MAKSKTQYVCSNCNSVHLRWAGKCAVCDEWNTLVETFINGAKSSGALKNDRHPEAVEIVDSRTVADQVGDMTVLSTGSVEFDRALGGGLTIGSVTLIGGEPGIGKSTILSQLLGNAASRGEKVLYVSAEESQSQVASRLKRVNALDVSVGVLVASDIMEIEDQIAAYSPTLVVVDSIQTVEDAEIASSAGSVVQVRECASRLIGVAKAAGIALVLVGHVTKDGSLAGPRVLEHLVDTVAYFEGDRDSSLRVVRVIKHRFGPVGDLGMFEMTAKGLRDLENATGIHLIDRVEGQSGSVVFPSLDGRRVLLSEIQALVVPTSAEQPRRVITGIEFNRFLLLLAVLEKKAGVRLHNKDVFVSVAGGFKISDPAADLALLAAVVSSLKDRPIASDLVLIGEVGLGGEIRSGANEKQRLNESARHGFRRAVVGMKSTSNTDELVVSKVTDLQEAMRAVSLH